MPPPENPPSQNPINPALDASAMLQAPWRLPYLEAVTDADQETTTGGSRVPPVPASCFISDYWANPAADTANHIILRSAKGLIFLNAYPYANGHLLIAHAVGRARLTDYTPAQRAELWQLVDCAADLAETALQPQGLNIGLNQGRAGGAGVPQHLHVHLVPRWGGDTNFITTVGRIRVIPSSLQAMHARYLTAWKQIAPRWSHVL